MGKTKIKYLGDGDYTLLKTGQPAIPYSKGSVIEVDQDVAAELLARTESGKPVWEAADAAVKPKTTTPAPPASN